MAHAILHALPTVFGAHLEELLDECPIKEVWVQGASGWTRKVLQPQLEEGARSRWGAASGRRHRCGIRRGRRFVHDQ